MVSKSLLSDMPYYTISILCHLILRVVGSGVVSDSLLSDQPYYTIYYFYIMSSDFEDGRAYYSRFSPSILVTEIK